MATNFPTDPVLAEDIVERAALSAGATPKSLRIFRERRSFDRTWQAPILEAFGVRTWGAMDEDTKALLLTCRAATQALTHLVDDNTGGAIVHNRGKSLERRVWRLACMA